jgi:hypothetical protein
MSNTRLYAFVIVAVHCIAANSARAQHAAVTPRDIYVVERFLIGDSIVASASALVSRVTRQQNVRNVSGMLLIDHELLRKRMLAVVDSSGLTREPEGVAAVRQGLLVELETLRAHLAGPAQDSAYLSLALREHASMLALVESHVAIAGTPALARDLRARRSVLEQHVNRTTKVREKVSGSR